MLAAFTKLKNAEKVKKNILKKQLLNYDYLLVKEFDSIYFPLTKKAKIPLAQVINTKFSFPKRTTTPTIQTILKNKLTKTQLKLLPSSQEIIGNILILEIPKELQKKEKIIAEAYLKTTHQVNTVVKKHNIHSGIFRTRKVRILAGKRTKETIHKENSIKLKLHLEKTYYSPRSANERLRISKQIKRLETILVMFSGAAPYPLVIAKNTPAKHILGIELNPLAHQYSLENITLNKLEAKITIREGDVRRILPKIRKKFDRIIMPLPKTGNFFIGLALTKAKPNTIIHNYSFCHENDIPKEAKRIKKLCQSFNHPVRILRKVKCGQFSPGVFRVCFDLKVLK